jgi:2-(1,2-epoxy-1,2-dihydrophenyl)acetyl-CoA isomerase
MRDISCGEDDLERREGLEISREGAVVLLTLSRESRRNLIDDATARAMSDLLVSAQTDSAVRAVVITGTGRDYCTGGDISADPEISKKAAAASPMDMRWMSMPFIRLFRDLWELDKPVVSAVNGTVAGIGWMMALLADLVVAAEGARWTHVFTRRGLIPHAGDTYFMPRIIPFHRLNEIALLGDAVTADTLHGWGLVNRLVPKDKVLPTAMELAERLATGPTRTLGLTKRLYRRSLESNLAGMYNEETAGQALNATTSDRTEGMRAFAEGRAPKFTGE